MIPSEQVREIPMEWKYEEEGEEEEEEEEKEWED